ncbi:DUF6896 domain-containing protein [Lentzea sp. NPDC092896]|uniref:DUF6896 domain-containing protein n=1 Tax=Lentzea sp. NPDC092896 TaxID=3364127 RepID=UPI00381F23D6
MSNGAADCISSFLRHRALIRTALVASYPQLDRVEHALEAFRAGELERNAELESGFAYAVHGRGLRMTGPDGEVVELDLLLDGTEAFDVWRLQEFARSIGMNPVPLGDDLARECLGMKQKGFFEEPEPAWFRIIE